MNVNLAVGKKWKGQSDRCWPGVTIAELVEFVFVLIDDSQVPQGSAFSGPLAWQMSGKASPVGNRC